jgi:outer membrane protein assembly factor BamB
MVAMARTLLVALALATFVSCGHGRQSGVRSLASGVQKTNGNGVLGSVFDSGLKTQDSGLALDAVLRDIDAYPVPKGVSAETWAMLATELKKLLVARSVDGKTLSIAPTGNLCKVTDLAAVSNPAGTQATVTWTEALAGDCNNDGEVSIADLQPIAAHYGESSSGPGSPAYLADADESGEVGITDLQPIAADYSMHIEGYEVWRGHYNGASTDWEATFRPNVGNPANTSFSADRPSPAPVSTRPTYTYLDDISALADKTTVRYKVVPFGDGVGGVESNEAIMPAPGPPYWVSGTVTDSGVGGLAGVLLTLTPGGYNATTQANGAFVITGVPNGSYTLTPMKNGYSFSPMFRNVTVSGADVTGQDFVASVSYSVSGAVTEQGVGLGGVSLTLTPGGLNATTQTDGTYTLTGVANGSYTLTPAMIGYTFTPTNRTVTVTNADVTAQFFTATHVSNFSVSGTVVLSSTGAPQSGVTLTLSPGGYDATTQADGTYAITGVAAGSYALAPSKGGMEFAPASRRVVVSASDVTGQDFAGDAVALADSPWPKFRGNARNTGLSPYVGAQTNAVKWMHAMAFNESSSPAIGADGTLYVGSGDHSVYAFNPLDGSVKWTHATGGVVASSPAIGADGTVYIGSDDGNVYALNPADGSVKWSTPVTHPWSSPAIGADGTVCISGYALDPADGSVKWTYPGSSSIGSSPAVGADGTLYSGGCAINPDGSIKWSSPIGGAASSPAIGVDSTVYVGSVNHNLYALDPSDGSVKWAHVTGGIIGGSPAIDSDGTVYIGSDDDWVYALNPADGGVKWTFATGGNVSGSATIGADGTVYIGSADGNVYALNALDGSVKWSYPAATGTSSSPAIGGDGTVYVNGGSLCAFGP